MEHSLENIDNWGKLYQTNYLEVDHFEDGHFRNRLKLLYPNHFVNGIWNKICIRCEKDLSKELESRTDGKILGHEYMAIYRKVFHWTKAWHCTDCGNKYERCITKNRNKAYNLLKRKDEEAECEITGCSKGELKKHLESLFDDKMNWENRNTYWQIDHKIPICWFDFYNEDELKYACNYKNIQPLERELNMMVKMWRIV